MFWLFVNNLSLIFCCSCDKKQPEGLLAPILSDQIDTFQTGTSQTVISDKPTTSSSDGSSSFRSVSLSDDDLSDAAVCLGE